MWQLGVLVYVLLTGRLPWQKACVTDPHYSEYLSWRKRRSLRTPKRFANFTSRLLRLLKRLLEPKAEKRAAAKEVVKYLEDRWLVRGGRGGGRGGDGAGEVDGQSVCYSSFSAHSCPREKDRLLGPLKARGIETTVDRLAKRQRIHEWLERSVATTHGPAPAPPLPLLPRGEVTRHPQPAQAPAAAVTPTQDAKEAAAAAAARRLQYQQVAALAVRAAAAAAARDGGKLPRDANHNTRAPLAQAEDESPGRREAAPWVPLQRSRTDSYLLGGSPRPPRHDHSRGASLDTDDSEDDDPRPPPQPLKPLPPLTLPRPTPAR